MSYTEFDSRLQGATAAAVWPTVDGSPTYALMVASPVTNHVTLVDLLARLPGSASLQLPDLRPHAISVDPGREEGWIWCDSGYVVRVGVEVANSRPRLVEQARAQVALPNTPSWVITAQSVAAEDRRICSGRAPLPGSGLGASAYLQREENTDRRLIDTRSHRVVIGPLGGGAIGVFSTEVTGIVELARLSSVTPKTEAAAFSYTTGHLYVIDSGGQAAIMELLQTNELRRVGSFTFANVQGPIVTRIASGRLIVLCERRNRMLVWDLADPLAPELVLDTALDSGLYWERNPIRDVVVRGGFLLLNDGEVLLLNDGEGGIIATDADGTDYQILRKFGSVPSLLDHGDYPLTMYGSVTDGTRAFEWALHGEIGALTYTLPIVAAAYNDTTSTLNDTVTGGPAPPPYRYVRLTRPSPTNPTFTFTMPGLADVAYQIRLRIRGRIEGKSYTQGAAALLNAFGAAETSAGYDARQTQLTLVRNIRWGTWTPAAGTVDNPYITVAAPGQDNYAKFFIAASDAPGTIHAAYTRVIDSVMKLRLNGGQTIVLTLDWGGDAVSVGPSKVVATGINDTYVYPDNIALMPPDDDPSHPLVHPWLPRFPADPTVFNNARRPFVQLDVTHVQLAPGY